MRLTAYFSQNNYARHGMPIVDELRERDVEVDCWARDTGAWWGPPYVDLFREQVAPVVMVASHQDARLWLDRRLVYVEHGAGQTYEVDERLGVGFPGGGGLDHVALFVCPSERVARRWRARYPQAAVEIVGCPALARLERAAEPIVAMTAHHNTFGDIPEMVPALAHYDIALPALRDNLAARGVELVGHAHPRGRGQMVARWAELGVRYEPDPDRILQTALLLIADNTSLLYEAAAVDLPVLCLNAPWYRRSVEHGLRFWSYVPGLQCNSPDDLLYMVREALADPAEASALRTRAAQYAYAAISDGADRAADAILPILEGAPMPETNSRHLGEVIDRLYQLGASDDIVNALRDAQPDEQSDEVERLRRLNDAVLASEIAQALAAHAGRDSELDVMDAGEDLDGAALELLSLDSDEEVLAAVGTDAELAARLFRLESAQPEPSTALLAVLAGVAGIAYEPPVVELPPVEEPPPVVEPPTGQESGEDLGDEQVVEPG